MKTIPDDMDIPASRRDLSDEKNVRWLLRNLPIKNKNHPKFKNVINELTKILK
jgi:hypothetical protein|tara:strand:- start:864 stop:1022 length:159 start_codon:yes stop_codon:yes gene_type:complete